MRKIFFALLFLFVTGAAQAQLTFVIDYSLDANNFFNTHQDRKDAFQAAVNYVGTFISGTTLSAITPGGGNSWTSSPFNPASTTLAAQNFSNLTIAANTIVIYAGGTDLTGIGSGVLAVGGLASASASGSQAFFNTIDFRGNGSFSMTSVGSISFSTTFNFAYDTDITTKESFPGQADFFSVAIHELGHVLGIGTNDSWNALAVGAGNTFLGGASTAANGGIAPTLTSDHGHWASGTFSTVFGTNTVQDTSMSPTISFDQRKFFTTLDVAGLKDIGFTTIAVPEPAHYTLVFGVAGLGWCLYRRRRALS